MIPADVERFWMDYLAAERVRIRQESLDALDSFMNALLQLPVEVWQPWARQLSRQIVDEGDSTPIRLPLFQKVIFPALLAGIHGSVAGSCRCLAGFALLLYKSPSCATQLPQHMRSEFGLLQQAVQTDPTDKLAKQRLLALMRYRFEYVLHELPVGVLYGQNGATIEECDELLVELSDYEHLAAELGDDEEDCALIAKSRLHIPAYKTYLSEEGKYASYQAFLSIGNRT